MKTINVGRAVLLSGLLLAITPVWAAIIPSLQSVSPNGSGAYTWTYSVSLAADQNAIGRSTAPGDSTSAGIGVTSTVSDYFTIYDFAGYVANSAVAPNSDWSLRVSTVGSTPSDTIPTDNTSLFNLTWYLNSNVVYVGPQSLGLFAVDSIYNLETLSNYTGQGTRNSGAAAGTEVSNIGTVSTPLATVASVPEPATFTLLAFALAGMAFARRRARWNRERRTTVMHRRRSGLVAALGCAALMTAAGAHATIELIVGNNPQPDEQLIFFDAATSGTTISGEIGSSGVAIQFESLTGQTLQSGTGASSITNEAGGALTSIAFNVPGGLFGDFILNLTNLTGSVTIAGSDNLGNPFSFSSLTGSTGNNFFTLIGVAGESFSQLSVTATSGGFDALDSPHISSVCQYQGDTCVPIATVPEPATFALLGLALVGLAFTRRRGRDLVR